MIRERVGPTRTCPRIIHVPLEKIMSLIISPPEQNKIQQFAFCTKNTAGSLLRHLYSMLVKNISVEIRCLLLLYCFKGHLTS